MATTGPHHATPGQAPRAGRPGTAWPSGGTPPPSGRYGPEAYQGRPPRPSAWTAARIVAVLLGVLLALFGLGALGTGLTLGFFHVVARDDGYVTGPSEYVSSEGYAVLLGDARVDTVGVPVDWPGRILGDARIRAESLDGGEIFVGIAPAFEARGYLDGVHHHEIGESPRWSIEHDGGAPASPPTQQDFWRAEAAGPGVQSAEVDELTSGRWALVVMSPDAAPGIDARVDVGATLPWLPWVAVTALLVGLVALAGALALIVGAARGAAGGRPPGSHTGTRRWRGDAPAQGPPPPAGGAPPAA